MKITPQHKLYVDLIVQDLYPNLEEAYHAAGFRGSRSCASKAARDLAPQIAEARALVQQERAKLIALDKVTILEHMAAVAMVDMRDFFESNQGGVQLKNWNSIPDQAKRAVKKIRTSYDKDGNQNVQLEFHDKLAGLEKLKEWVYGEEKLLTTGEEDSKTEDVKTIVHIVENGRMKEKDED